MKATYRNIIKPLGNRRELGRIEVETSVGSTYLETDFSELEDTWLEIDIDDDNKYDVNVWFNDRNGKYEAQLYKLPDHINVLESCDLEFPLELAPLTLEF